MVNENVKATMRKGLCRRTASDFPGCGEIVDNGKTGLIVRLQDADDVIV